MKPDMFRQPVSILVGLGFLAEVRSVMDAYRHLSEWPASNRDTAHSIGATVFDGWRVQAACFIDLASRLIACSSERCPSQ